MEPFLEVGVLKEPLARAFYPVFHTVLVPLVGGVLSALGQAKQPKMLFLAVRQVLLLHYMLQF